jgi:hypothetical protein
MKVLVVSHDAGGAEILSAYVRRHRDEWPQIAYVLAGPAIDIFRRKLDDGNFRWSPVPEGIDVQSFDLVLCGTGSTGFEIFAWRMAKVFGVRTVVWLDHWKNYRERFETEDGLSLPDEVWVCDEHAYHLARAALPAVDPVVVGNPYEEDFLREVASWFFPRDSLDTNVRTLYVCDKGNPNPPENLVVEGDPYSEYLRVRPHPADETPQRTLAEDVAWADTVVGTDSMAMALALKAGRRVISVLPSSEPLTIPYPRD